MLVLPAAYDLVWRGLDSDEKTKWEKRAGEAREEWRAKNPDWRFSKAGNGFIGYSGKSGGGGGTKAKGTRRKKKKGSQKERCEQALRIGSLDDPSHRTLHGHRAAPRPGRTQHEDRPVPGR